MNYDLLIVGFGVIGTETLFELAQKQSKKISIAVIDRNISNIPGGIAYSKNNSKYGFFNNPLRLSNSEFIKWIKKNENINNILNFINNNPEYNLKTWLSKNTQFRDKIKNKFSEIYFPRLFYSFFLNEKIIKALNLLKKKKIKINFFEGNLIDIKSGDKFILRSSNKFKKFNLIFRKNNFIPKKKNKKFTKIVTKKIIIGNGILPPKKIDNIKLGKNNNYIWDFYAEGGSQNLVKKILKLKINSGNIKIGFIGNKAGLLEALPVLEILSDKFNNKLKITSFAKNSLSLEKAEISEKMKLYKPKYLNAENLNKLSKSIEILKLLINEFNYAKKKGFNKYDVWTLIQKKKILLKCFKKLSHIEKLRYNEFIFPKIRNLTRYTYPETVYCKDRLVEKKILSFKKDKVIRIIKKKNFIKIKTLNKKMIKFDILVNVSGPVSLEDISSESPFVKSLKKICNNYNKRGFIADRNFNISKGIYAPGTLSSNFNPDRLTIIRAITENSKKSVNHLIKNLK